MSDARLLAYLRILELRAMPTSAELHDAYRRLCKRYHPDRFAADAERSRIATEILVELNAAYAYVRARVG